MERQSTGQPEDISKADAIPPQYVGLPSDVVEELWELPVMSDPAEYAAAVGKRDRSLNLLKTQEHEREDSWTEQLGRSYQGLTSDQQGTFPEAQQRAGQRVVEHIQGRSVLSTLSREEAHVLRKLQHAYHEFIAVNPTQAFAFEFSQDIDRKIYANLVQRLAFHELATMQTHEDQTRIAQVRNEAGLPRPTEAQSQPEHYLDWPYAKKLNDLARDVYYTLSPAEKGDYNQRGVGEAMALLLYIPFGKRDKWPERNVSGDRSPSKEDCIQAAMKVEAYLKERGLI